MPIKINQNLKMFFNNIIFLIILPSQNNTFYIGNASNNMNKKTIHFTKDISLSKNNFILL